MRSKKGRLHFSIISAIAIVYFVCACAGPQDQIRILEPLDKTESYLPFVTVAGVVRDTHATVTINNIKAVVSETGYFRTSAKLEPETNIIRIMVVFSNGEEVEREITIFHRQIPVSK